MLWGCNGDGVGLHAEPYLLLHNYILHNDLVLGRGLSALNILENVLVPGVVVLSFKTLGRPNFLALLWLHGVI